MFQLLESWANIAQSANVLESEEGHLRLRGHKACTPVAYPHEEKAQGWKGILL